MQLMGNAHPSENLGKRRSYLTEASERLKPPLARLEAKRVTRESQVHPYHAYDDYDACGDRWNNVIICIFCRTNVYGFWHGTSRGNSYPNCTCVED